MAPDPNLFTGNGSYGYEYNPVTALYHVGAWEYDPRTARWLQRDPIDASSGDPNLYRYAGNDPINQVDPDGTDWSCHDLLDAAGFIPGLGEAADAINAIGYAIEGDWANAAISAAGMLPGGDALKAGRLAKKVVRGGAATISRAAATQGVRNAAGRGASIRWARQLGRAGEQRAGIRGPKKSITTPQGKRRVPDEVKDAPHFTLTEVKNVRELRYTKQLQDYLRWCEDHKYKFVLITRRNTVLDRHLQDLIKQGRIIHKPIL